MHKFFRTTLCLTIIAITLTTHARLVRNWSDTELRNASTLVVLARPIANRDLDETNSLGWTQTAPQHPKFRGVETTFQISKILKGQASSTLILHHYRFTNNFGDSIPNGPTFITFPPNTTNQYLLYLIPDATNRFAPTAGQIDPSFSIKPLP